MGRPRVKAKSRRDQGAFLALPFSVLNSDNFKKLSPRGIKLLFDIAAQLRMKMGGAINNGDLCVTMKIMSQRGWNSKNSLYTARDELLHYGFIQVTRMQQYISQCNLYALTFLAIDECDNKLDVSATRVPVNTWKLVKPKYQKKRRNKNKSLYQNSTSVVPHSGTKNPNLAYLKVVG